MRSEFITITIMLLFSALCWSCSNELEEIQNYELSINEMNVCSRSAGSIDYSQYTLLENRIVMPRTGQVYTGSITYNGADFPISIYWNPNVEYYNLYAIINGTVENPFTPGNVKRYTLQHVATYDSESTIQAFWFVIKCNFIIEYYYNDTENRHVSFRIIFNPNTQVMTYDIIEEGTGLWGPEP